MLASLKVLYCLKADAGPTQKCIPLLTYFCVCVCVCACCSCPWLSWSLLGFRQGLADGIGRVLFSLSKGGFAQPLFPVRLCPHVTCNLQRHHCQPRNIGLQSKGLGQNVRNCRSDAKHNLAVSRGSEIDVYVFMSHRLSWLASPGSARKGTASLWGCKENCTCKELLTLCLMKKWETWWMMWPWQSTQLLLHQWVIKR